MTSAAHKPAHSTILAVVLSAAYFLAMQSYFVGVTRGGDRNGYLLGGRMLADGHARGIKVPDPYIFLGPHWVMVSPGRYALKYPLGLPAIYAVVHAIFGAAHWMAAAHEISPLAASLALLGAFLLFRPLIGDFRAMLGMILLACSPVTFFFANLPNSHAVALCTAVWGMAALFRWWRSGAAWCAIAAGLLLGFNFTVRYSEGLLLLPLLMVYWFTVKENKSAWKKGLILPLAWLTPVMILIVFNLITLHHLTGYSLTNESTAFSLHWMLANGRSMATQLYDNVLWLLLPFSILGLVLIFRANRELAMVLLSWIVPTILLYTAYYWSPTEEPGLSYARFILTVLPALILAGLWFPRRSGTATTIAIGVVVAIISARNLGAAAARSEDLQWEDLGSRQLQEEAQSHIPPDSSIFSEGSSIPLLELTGNWRLYYSNLFTRGYIQTFAAVDPNAPRILQPKRAEQLYDLLGGKTDAELVAAQMDLIHNTLAEGRGVYVILPAASMEQFRRRIPDGANITFNYAGTWTIDPRWRNPSASEAPVLMQIATITLPPPPH